MPGKYSAIVRHSVKTGISIMEMLCLRLPVVAPENIGTGGMTCCLLFRSFELFRIGYVTQELSFFICTGSHRSTENLLRHYYDLRHNQDKTFSGTDRIRQICVRAHFFGISLYSHLANLTRSIFYKAQKTGSEKPVIRV